MIKAFPSEDRSKDVDSLDLFIDDLPIRHNLKLLWNMLTETFMFQIEDDQNLFTCRGVRSTENSLYDFLGFLASITVHGRLILRELTTQAEDWDSHLPKDTEIEGTRWKQSLEYLEGYLLYILLHHRHARERSLCFCRCISQSDCSHGLH